MTARSRTYDKSLSLFGEARSRIPGGAQTNSKRPTAFAYGAYPIYFAAASGCHVTDIDGNEFIDLVSALGPISLGYTYPGVDDAIRDQLAKGIISGLLSPLEVDVARLLADLVPCAERVRFFKGGGEATAAAARVARRYTGREIIPNCGYRGWPDTWSAASNDGGIPKGLEGSVLSFPFNDQEQLEQLVLANPGKIAAISIDVQVTPPEPGYLGWIRDLAHEVGALFILDEIVTGFRLANGGAQAYFGVTPDLSVFAKGIANGMPLAVVAGTSEVMESMTDAVISITYGGEALSLAAAKATLEIYQQEPVIATLWERGRQLQAGLTDAANDAAVPFATTGFAPMSAMTLSGLTVDDEKDAWTYLLQEMADRGVLLRRGGLNFVSYSHQQSDIDEVIAAASDVFAQLSPLLKRGDIRRHLRSPEADAAFRSFR